MNLPTTATRRRPTPKPLAWYVLDVDTLEPVVECRTREEARALAKDRFGKVAKLILA